MVVQTTKPSAKRVKAPPLPRSSTATAATVRKERHLIDAEGVVLGRLASFIAKLLIGKHKVDYTPHVDGGDNIVVINGGKIALTGDKLQKKLYYRHSGYPGGISSSTPERILAGKRPQSLLVRAVWGMLKNNPMGRRRLKNLKVYSGAEHPGQEGLKPLDFAALNPKNKRARIGS